MQRILTINADELDFIDKKDILNVSEKLTKEASFYERKHNSVSSKAVKKLSNRLTAMSRRAFLELDEFENTNKQEDFEKHDFDDAYKPATSHINYVNLSENLGMLVVHDVLSKKDPVARALALERWVAVNDLCKKRNDLFSVSVLSAAFGHFALALPITKLHLSPETRERFGDNSEFAKFTINLSRANHAITMMKELIEKKGRIIPVYGPFISVMEFTKQPYTMRDYDSAKEKEQAFKELDGVIKQHLDPLKSQQAKNKKRQRKNKTTGEYYDVLTKKSDKTQLEADLEFNRRTERKNELDFEICDQRKKFEDYSDKWLRKAGSKIGGVRYNIANQIYTLLNEFPSISDIETDDEMQYKAVLIIERLEQLIKEVLEEDIINQHKFANGIKETLNKYDPFQFEVTLVNMLNELNEVLEVAKKVVLDQNISVIKEGKGKEKVRDPLVNRDKSIPTAPVIVTNPQISPLRDRIKFFETFQSSPEFRFTEKPAVEKMYRSEAALDLPHTKTSSARDVKTTLRFFEDRIALSSKANEAVPSVSNNKNNRMK